MKLEGKEKAYWLADKIHALGDYAKEAAQVLQQQADEIERLKAQVNALEHIRTAAQNLARCKGRYHTEQNFNALIAALEGKK